MKELDKRLQFIKDLLFLPNWGKYETDANIESIQEDLDILKIIKDKNVSVPFLRFCVNEYKDDKIILKVYNRLNDELNKDNLKVLKEWLKDY